MFDAAVIDDALPANPVASTSRLRGQRKEVQALSVEDPQRSPFCRGSVDDEEAARPKAEQGHARHRRPLTRDRLTDRRGAGHPLERHRRRRDPADGLYLRDDQRDRRGTYRKPKPKSDASQRSIAISPFAVGVLMRRRIEQPANHYDAVFATRNGTWPQVGNIERRWRTIQAASGFEWVTPHTFRKTVATLIDRRNHRPTSCFDTSPDPTSARPDRRGGRPGSRQLLQLRPQSVRG